MKTLTTASCAALVLGLLGASASLAATDLSFSGLSGAEYDTAGVYVLGDVNFTATDDDTGTGLDEVVFQLWDDGEIKFETTYALAVGDTGSFHFEVYYPGLVGTFAQGVGLVLSDVPNSNFDLVIDPYDVPHYADPGECTVDCGPAAVPLPASLPLLFAGLGGLGGIGVFKRRRKAA